MHFDGGGTRVGRNRDTPQRRFPLLLAFVAALFYIAGDTGKWMIGAKPAGEISIMFETSVSIAFRAEPDQPAVRPHGASCRKAGRSALAAAIPDPDILAQSAVVRDNRRVSAIFACLKALSMEQAGGSAERGDLGVL